MRGVDAIRLGALIAVVGCAFPATADNVAVTNLSASSLCAAEDNVSVGLTGTVKRFMIRATHPAYTPSTYACATSTANCAPSGSTHNFTPGSLKLFEDATWKVWAYRDATWWRATGMTATSQFGALGNVHRVVVQRKIEGTSSFADVAVMWADGNVQAAPQPPTGQSAVCMGTSVLVGPITTAPVPYAAVTSVEYSDADNSIVMTYAGGGATRFCVAADRTETIVQTEVDYTPSTYFAILRSMHVDNTNCDAERLELRRGGSQVADQGVLTALADTGNEIRFYRTATGAHNPSAPDIRVVMPDQRGDFNRDGYADLLFRNSNNGRNVVWFMRGATYLGSAELTQLADTNWECCAIDDLDTDGDSDVIWFNRTTGALTAWFFNGTTYAGLKALPNVADTLWRPAGTGDVNDDLRPDLIWRHSTTGSNAAWLLREKALRYIGAVTLPTTTNTTWSIFGISDIDLDCDADMLWRRTTGSVQTWSLNRQTYTGAVTLPSETDPAWVIVAFKDMDNDGDSDIVWQHTNGSIRMWQADRGGGWTTIALPSVNAAWRIQE